MAENTGNDGFSEDDDFFSGGRRDGASERRGESLDEILRDGSGGDRRDESIANIHTGSKEPHIGVMMDAPPEGAPPPELPDVESSEYIPDDPPPPIDPIDVDQQAAGSYQPEERGLNFGFRDAERTEDRVFEEYVPEEDDEEIRRGDDGREGNDEELILTPTQPREDDDPTLPPDVDDRPSTPLAANSVLDEDDLAAGTDGDGPRSITQPLVIDFGDDGAGSVRLDIPESLRELNVGKGGTPLTLSLSADGAQIQAVDSDGDAVFSVTLNNNNGNYSYTFELQGSIDHGDLDQIDLPIGIAVTDSDGDLAVGEFSVGIVDDAPVARDDETQSVEEGGGVIGSDDGADNLLENDDQGADGALIFQFTYTDENGEEQTARAGETVDTENGTLTVNADGSWTFEADDSIDHSDGNVVADSFTYSIVDADGDTSSATQIVEITDDGPTIGFPPEAGDPDDRGDQATLFEKDIDGGNASVTQALDIDYGADGEGSVELTIPQELEDMNLTADGQSVTYELSEDGHTIVATAGGESVFTLSLNEDGGDLSYTFELQGNLDHPDAGSDILSNLPFGLRVTDGDGSSASAEIKINVVDDQPEAVGEVTLNVEEGGNAVGSDNGGANLLANDDLGADGGTITSFTYKDENGDTQTADAGSTVDTENGTLTVNSDGSWSFTSDENADHSNGAVSDKFTYTVTDGDGDTSSATQNIIITDDGPQIPPNPPEPPVGDLPAGDQPDIGRADLIVDEDNMGATISQSVDVDFGVDGFGSASISVPQALVDKGLTSGGDTITYSVSEDGQTITAEAAGEPVFTVTLSANAETGDISYSVELQGTVDHPATGAGDDLLSNLPVTLTVTDGDGTEASTNLEIGIRDDAPDATNDETVTLDEGGNTVGSDNGGDNLLANDDLGADGGTLTSFTYTDEDGNQQTADAGSTVDTENGTLTVNADGSWSFTSDENADHSNGAVSDGFTYTITDGDGDTASATQNIVITDDGPQITPPDGGSGEPGAEGYSVTLDEDNLGSGNATTGGQALNIDFGADGEGSVALSVPQELEDMQLTSGGEAVTFTVSEDGQSITGATPDGSPVMTITLNEDNGSYSYSVELSDNLDHTGANGETISDIPVTLTVTDGDGDTATASLNVNVIDDAPDAINDETVTLDEGGNTVGSDNGGDNLLANDDLGADGGTLTSFTYTDESGNQQTADAGSTVDTENGSLTVNADGSWSFTSDENADHSNGAVSDGFTYTITDGDGDTASATQNIVITDDGPQITTPDGSGEPGAEGYSVTLDEDNLGSGNATTGGQALNIDFGADGEGSVALSVPQELEDMNLTSGGEAVTFTVSEDGQSITGATPDGSPVMTITLNEDNGNYSYSVELSDNLDHTGANGETISDIPVTLTVTDGDGDTATASLNVNVIDDAPDATNDETVTLDEGGNTVGSDNGGDNLLANDDLGADGGTLTSFTYTDENGDTQTANAGSTVDTENGSLTVNADGSWSFTSDENADHSNGAVSDGFTYTITDGDGDTASATQNIVITDDGPQITPPDGSGEPGAEGYSVTLDEDNLGSGNATAGGQALNIDFGADGEGSVALSVPQELEDMNLTSGGEAVTFTVSEDGQSITGATPDGSPVMTITLNEDNGNYSYSVELSDNLDHTGANGETISDIPVTLTVADGDGDTATAILNVNVIDDAPDATNDETVTLDEGGNTVGSDNGGDNLLANDDLGADGGTLTSFTYTDESGNQQTADAGSTVDTENGSLTVNADGSWSFTSDETADHSNGAVSDGFTYTITDGDGDTASATQNIVITDDGPQITPPDGSGEPGADGYSVTLDEDNLGSGSTTAGGQALNIDFGADGEGSVALSVPQELEDMQLTSDGEAVTFTVSEDGQSITGATPDGSPVMTITLNEDNGSYSYSVELSDNLDHTGANGETISDIPVTLTVTDGDGDTATASLNVNVIDDAPDAINDETVTLDEGGNTVGSDNGGDNLLANDDLGADGGTLTSFTYTDEDGNQQTADAGSTVDTENGSLTVNADGSWSFTSDENADHSNGAVSDGFTYTITDGDGDTASATQNIVITDDGPQITPPDGSGEPGADGYSVTLDEDNLGSGSTTAGGQALNIDFGADGEGSVALSVPQELEDMNLTSDGEAVTFTVSEDGQSITGATPDGSPVMTITLNEDNGNYSYSVELSDNLDHTGANGETISDIPVTLTVTDGDGDTATASLNVNVIDDAPDAINDETVTLDEGGNTVGSDNGGDNLLANDDLGADGGTLTSFTYTDEDGNQQTADAGSTVDTENGSLTVNADGSWSFTSDENADHSNGAVSDGFTYTITDGDGDTASATQNIVITDDGPQITPPDGGSGEPGADGYSVTLDEDNLGSGSTASGGQALNIDFGADGEGSVALSVPQELEDMNLTSGGEAVTFTVSEDGQSITGATPDGSPVMTITLNEDNGNYSYSVELSDNLDHTGANGETISDIPVTLTVTDGDGDTATASLNVNVIDDAPDATNDETVTLDEGGNTVGSDNGGDNLLANDDLGADGGTLTSFTYTDEDGNQQTADAGSTVDTENGSLTVNADGSWSFTSDENADHSNGAVSDGFTYTITDGDGDTASATQNIVITDDGPQITPPDGGSGEPGAEGYSVTLDEDNLGSGNATIGGQALNIDFGADGEGSVSLSVPQELEDLNLTSGGEAVTFTVSEDGQSITGATPDGSPVMTITLNEDNGNYSYSVELSDNLDHTGANGETISDIPVTLTVTDGDGDTATASLNVNVIDDAPDATNDETVTLDEGGNTVGSDNGGDNLLANDDLGADGGTLTSFTYTDEDGNQQTADAGSTVDTENGSLTVNADGSWSFTSDETADHSNGAVSDGFTYTITDGDGDTASATQNIVITDDGPQITPPDGSGEPGADGYSVTLDEDNLGSGNATTGGQALNIDFGADGEGSVALSVPQELEDMNLTSDGEAVTFTVSEDGQSITGATPDGSPVMTITLNEDNGNYSYSVELSDNLDHTGANGETISDIPVTLTVTDGDGDTATASLNVNVIDDAPGAVDDGSFNVADGGETIGTANGADNLLANDDLGADGGAITSFTYTDEAGNQQSAEAGSTVDTQQGSLTVNADGTWSFESDDLIESADGSAVMDNFTYTITDGDGDTATASVEINVSDGTAQPPSLVVGDAEGYEDNAIPLNINASLADTDGSESLSITISGVPNGASLSAGTDNGDGTWTLEEGDLDGLTVTPPTDSDVDFDLSVSVTSTEASTGETSTVETSFTVEVDAVADTTTVSATTEAKLVSGDEQVTQTVTGEGHIDASNFNEAGQGYTVSARTLNSDGSLSEASTDNVSSQSGGLGVKGNASSGEPDAQLGHNPETDTSEQLVIDFDHDVTELSFSVGRLYSDEGDSKGDAAGNEQGKWQVYDDGELVAEGTFDNESGNTGTFSIDLPDGVSFNQIVFSATEYSGGDGEQTGDSSDYFITDLNFGYEDTVIVTEEGDPHCEVTVNVDATYGDFTDGSENHFVFVEVPDGWEPAGDDVVEVDSSDYPQLPSGSTFVKVPVSAEQIQEGNGSVSVPVTFNVANTESADDVQIDVFAAAIETNLDGEELTTDNNSYFSNSSVTVEGKDLVAEPPEVDAEDATGYEDTAIPLHISASLTDTDGSESLSITISGVPEGATLSAGTDNGDGTWTLEEGDLDGLTVTPPTDSDADFELSVSATSTESMTGQTSTVETTLSVTVDAVADTTTVDGSAATAGVGDGDHAVTVNLNATFGDFEDGSESHFVLVEVPDGWSAPDGATVIDGGDVEGLPDQQFVRVEVSNDELAENDGSASISVTFQVPDNQASGDVSFNLISGAAETPSDGGELTLDNNTSYSSTTVTAHYEDGSPTVEVGQVQLDENNLGDGTTSATGEIDIDFGADGAGTVTISVPAELEDAGLTSGGETVTFTVSEDGQTITGTTPDGSPVMTITLNEDSGDYSYSVELQAPVDHNGDSGDLINDLPVTLNVTDGNGQTTEATLNIDIADAVPVAVDDRTITTEEGGNTVGSDNGGDNLLANDDLGADGGTLTSFTYTDEDGNQQTADAGSTVDTENGSLTVNADGSWSFTSDENADHSNGAVSDGFTYTITDGDGDTASATQNIVITDDDPQITPPDGNGEPGAEGYSVTLDEDNLGSGNATTGGQALNIDFGADGEGSVALSVPQELEDMQLTSDGEAVTFTVSEDGQSIMGATPDGSPVMTITLNEDNGNYSYSVELSDNLDHTGANGETISDIPVTLTVTDGDGDTATASLNVNVIDDAPEAVDDGSFNVADGGETIGTENGADNLLANDDIGADGGAITSFTYTDEAGIQQSAEAGSTVDTQQGSLTVNADGTWSFESDDLIESPDGSAVMDNFTYTITDGDGDTATASVEINVSDGTAQPPSLVVGDAEGYEDNAIPLNINASLADTDGSESLSITISGVPEGATLSAGTDNGDGTWTLEEGDLDGLTVTPPTDSDVDFDLSVSVTSTETSTGETSTVETSFTVEVDAVADNVGVSAEIKATIVEGETEVGEPETVTITTDNYSADDSGFSVSGRTLNSDGSLSDASTDNVSVKTNGFPTGFGVKGDASNGADKEIGYEDGKSEQVVVDFDQDVTTANVTISWQNPNEDCRITLYRDGEPVGTRVIEGGTDGVDNLGEFTADDGGSFDQIVFEATGVNSDFLVNAIEFEVAPQVTEPVCEVEIDVTATFGDYNDGSEQHFVFVEIPEGMTPADENAQTVVGNSENGLPEGETFVAIPVDAADIQAGNGTVTVPVSFTGPVPEDNTSINADVFAAAVETNLDGGEITFDNNMTLQGTSVELTKADITAEDPNLDASDSEGYEDTAIPLDISSSLNDTDGSESLSITISGVPEGATLSAGTDNGDGTWTLEEGDLDGLTVTPPTDSDVDFDLTVSATSTESSTGETSTVETSFTVEVDAVADTTSVSASVETSLVEGTEVSDGLSDITITNEGMESASYNNTYGYYIKDEDGNPKEGGIVFADTKEGVGESFTIEDVDADNIGYFVIPNGDSKNSSLSNGDPVTFEQDHSGNWHAVDSDGHRLVGTGDPVLFSDPELNEGHLDYTRDNSVEGNQNWEDIKGGGDNDFNDVNMTVVVTPNEPVVSEPHCEATVSIDATFGDYTDGSEGHYVFVEVPEGWTPVGEGVEVVDNGDVPQLPATGNFVRVSVPAETLQEGEGAVTVNITFDAPISETGADVQLNVFAGAVEENLDGAELTTDNNTSFSGSTVTIPGNDLTVSDPDIAVDDAAGLEDTAIPLDLNISLTDTDGSESMAITISGVPQGATLSAGTDNGDGTYTIEEGDLDGLTITPPHDSDVDFNLQVDIAVTESSTGETKTFSESVHVDVAADADAPTLNATLSVNEDSDTNTGSGGGTSGGTSAENDFVDNGSQNHYGTHQDDNFVVDRDLNMNENFTMGNGDDSIVVNGDTSQGHNFNMGNGDDSLTINGDINGNTAMDGGHGDDVLYLEGDKDQYTLRNFTNNQGHINTQIVDNETGQTMTVNNVEAISFGDGEVVGNADLVQRETGGETSEPTSTTYDLDIESALSDVDGSESLTITLGPIPDGVTFSAGTDNGDGTWSLEPEDLQELQMTVPADIEADFDLPIKATSTESENGDNESVNMSLRVELPEGHGSPTGDPEPEQDGSGHGSGHGTGQGTGQGSKQGSGHGTGHGTGHGSKQGSGHGTGHGSGHGYRHGSGHGTKHGSGHGSKYGSGHGSGHGKGFGSGHGHSSQGIAAASASGHGGQQGNNGFGNGDQDAPGDSGDHNNAENSFGDRMMAALDKFSNQNSSSHDNDSGDTFLNAGNHSENDNSSWFDEEQQKPADDDVFGKTELEQKEEEDQKAEEAAREEQEHGIQIPADDNNNPADFEDRSLV